jgi:hypothetical protein
MIEEPVHIKDVEELLFKYSKEDSKKYQNIIDLQEKVYSLYNNKIYEVIYKLYKFKLPKNEIKVILISRMDNESHIKIESKLVHFNNNIHYFKQVFWTCGKEERWEFIEVDKTNTFKFLTPNVRKVEGKVLYEVGTLMNDYKFLKRLIRNYWWLKYVIKNK